MQRRKPKSRGLNIETARVFLPLLVPRQFKGAEGGRCSGKSHFFGGLLIEEMMSMHIRAACVRETQNSIKESVKQLLEDKINQYDVASLFEVTETEIRGPHDSLAVFKGLANMTAASFKSMEGYNRAWYEEAQTLSVRSLELSIPTFRKVPGMHINPEQWFSWNPTSPKDAVEIHFNGNEGDPDFAKVTANWRDNPWFDESGQRNNMERDRRRDPDKYAHVWCGKYQKHSQARVFHNWRIAKPGEIEALRPARYYFGADWGFANDPTVLIRCFKIERGENDRRLYIDKEAVQVGCEIDDTPALFDTIPQSKRYKITADNARPETISFMNRHGYPNVKPCIKGKGSVEDGVEFLKSYDIVISEECPHTIDELSTYSYKIDPKTNEVLPKLEDENNHGIDAARYAMEDDRRSPMRISPEVLRRAAIPVINRTFI